jgi:hypothetical protein
MANNPFMPPSFVNIVPKGRWNVFSGPWEDGPGLYTNPANTGPPVYYSGTNQTSILLNANPKPPRQTSPGAADKSMSKIL